MLEPKVLWTPWPDAPEGEDATPDEGGGLAYRNEDEPRLPLPAVAVRRGVMPLAIVSSLGRCHSFRTLHTSFSLTPSIVNVLKQTRGVEVAHVLTRYRVVIGFARCFRVSQVKRLIEYRLGCYEPPLRVGLAPEGVDIDSLVLDAIVTADYWTVRVGPEGPVIAGYPGPAEYREGLAAVGPDDFLVGSHAARDFR